MAQLRCCNYRILNGCHVTGYVVLHSINQDFLNSVKCFFLSLLLFDSLKYNHVERGCLTMYKHVKLIRVFTNSCLQEIWAENVNIV